MTNHLENKLQCACCGMDIYAETSALDVSFKFMTDYKPGNGGTLRDYQANGAHLYRNGENPDDGFWIIPLCNKCNNPYNNDEMSCHQPTIVCEERGATEETD